MATPVAHQMNKIEWADKPLNLGKGLLDDEGREEEDVLGPGYTEDDLDGKKHHRGSTFKTAGNVGTISPGLGKGFTDEEVEDAMGTTIAIPAKMDENLGPGFTRSQVDESDFDIELGKALLGLTKNEPRPNLVPANAGCFGSSPRAHESSGYMHAPAASPTGGTRWRLREKLVSVWKVTQPRLMIRSGPHRLEPCIGKLQLGDEILAFERGGRFGSWIRHSHGWSCCVDRLIVPKMRHWKNLLTSEISDRTKLLERIGRYARYAERRDDHRRRRESQSSVGSSLEVDSKDELGALSPPTYNEKEVAKVQKQLNAKLKFTPFANIKKLANKGIVCALEGKNFDEIKSELEKRIRRRRERLGVLQHKIEQHKGQNFCYMRRIQMPETPIYRMRHVLRYFVKRQDTHFTHKHLLRSFIYNDHDGDEDDGASSSWKANRDSNDALASAASPARGAKAELRSDGWNSESYFKSLANTMKSEARWIRTNLEAKCRGEMAELRRAWEDPKNFKEFAAECSRQHALREQKKLQDGRDTAAQSSNKDDTVRRPVLINSLPLDDAFAPAIMDTMLQKAPFFYTILYHVFDILYFRSRMIAPGVHPQLVWKRRGKEGKKLDGLWNEGPITAERAREEEVWDHPEAFILSITAQESRKGIFKKRGEGPILKFYANDVLMAAAKPYPPLHRVVASRLNNHHEQQQQEEKDGEEKKKEPGGGGGDSNNHHHHHLARISAASTNNESPLEYHYLLRLVIPEMVWEKPEEGGSEVERSLSISLESENEEGHIYGRSHLKMSVIRSLWRLDGNVLPLFSDDKSCGVSLKFFNSGPVEIEQHRAQRDDYRIWAKKQLPDDPSEHIGDIDRVVKKDIIYHKHPEKGAMMVDKVWVTWPKEKQRKRVKCEILYSNGTIIFYNDLDSSNINRQEYSRLQVWPKMLVKPDGKGALFLKLKSQQLRLNVRLEFLGRTKEEKANRWATAIKARVKELIS